MQQVQKSIDEGVIISARGLSSKGALSSLTNEDKLLFVKGFRKTTAKLKKHETIVLEGTSHEILTTPNLMTSVCKNHNQFELTTTFSSTGHQSVDPLKKNDGHFIR